MNFEINSDSGEKRIEWFEENNGSKIFCSVPYDMIPESTPYVMLRFAKEKLREDLFNA